MTYFLQHIPSGHCFQTLALLLNGTDRSTIFTRVEKTGHQEETFVKMWRTVASVCVLLLGLCVLCSSRQPPDNRVEALEITRLTRDVDLTSPLAKEKVTMVLENKGKKPTSYVLYAVEPRLAGNVAHISAEVKSYSEWCVLFRKCMSA